ncbi:hypothetical protein RUM43_007778 [Polyplax serrata]|uniref:Uncharacterized protein n=1 Tax=Polyplax serrata TaxID=468196 RepID=A0AAN8P668_POLSC
MSPPDDRGAGVLRLLLTGIGGVKPPGTGDVKPPTPPGGRVPAEGDFHGGPGGASPPARNGEQVPSESSVVEPSSLHVVSMRPYLFARGGPTFFSFCPCSVITLTYSHSFASMMAPG